MASLWWIGRPQRSLAQTFRPATNALYSPQKRPLAAGYSRGLASSQTYETRREEFQSKIAHLPETHAALKLSHFLEQNGTQNTNQSRSHSNHLLYSPYETYEHEQTAAQWAVTLDAALATFALHNEARAAALMGMGFYTIGPCGEEALASVAHALRDQDDVALHYRHLAVNMGRQLLFIQEHVDSEDDPSKDCQDPLELVLLDRARGYTVSQYDPVAGGVHCSIGSASGRDFVVTSTLASQCPPAVGRALAKTLLPQSSATNDRALSFVTLGDGSLHNAHFWSAFHLARHARHQKIKCPVVFGVSDNGLSISYNTKGYCQTLFEGDSIVPLFRANGNDPAHVYNETKKAMDYARNFAAPAVILFENIIRKFGHAASDRQLAYLQEANIQTRAEWPILESMIKQAVELYNVTSYEEVRDRWAKIQVLTRKAFAQAAAEPKYDTRNDRGLLLDRLTSPLVPVPPSVLSGDKRPSITNHGGTRQVMRKHMTRVFEELLRENDTVVYMGEDVRHGGYYLVTDGLAELFPSRVLDFPPDETSLLGAALGFSQSGLTPIVEIPYAKYLDCGADMFYEIAVMHWLSSGSIHQPRSSRRLGGMVIRLQGFDRGVFGGNFHTHNMLPHIPPGVDVVCYSNGSTYVKGIRHAVLQALEAGRIVVTVDSTNLLNLRHLYENDRGWETEYPTHGEMLAFDEIIRHGEIGNLAIVTYGNGVWIAMQARRAMLNRSMIKSETEIDILECPYISATPTGLREAALQYEALVFADVCKQGPGAVLATMICSLQENEELPSAWTTTNPPRTYNPLGSLVTFLDVDDVVDACEKALAKIA